MIKVYKIVIFLIIQVSICNGTAAKFKIPQVTTFYKNEYNAGNRNWSIAHGHDGYVYIGNDKGLLAFDGINWTLSTIEGGRRIRTVYVAENGIIYTGGSREIGYWKRDEEGILQYTSLKPKLANVSLYNHEVWRIFEDKQHNVIFQGFAMLLKYDGETVDKVDVDRYPSLMVNVEGKLLASNRSGELLELTGMGFSPILKSEQLKTTIVKTAINVSDDLKLLVTKDKGIFSIADSELLPWNTEANKQLLKEEINCALFKNDLIYIGTINSGIFIIDKYGNILYKITSEIHLQDNTILSMEFDAHGRLWFAMSIGVGYAELNNPVNIVVDNNRRIGAIHDVAYFKGQLYLATNKGVFYSSYNKNDNLLSLDNFKAIEELKGLAWSLKVFDGQMFCGHNDGTFLLVEDKIVKLTNASGANTFRKMNVGEKSYVLANSYNSLIVFNKSDVGVWQFKNFVTGFSEPTKEIVLDYNNQIWLLHSWLNELYSIKLQENLRDPYIINTYGQDVGLPVDVNSHVTELNNRVIITSNKGTHTYDRLRDSIVVYSELNNHLSGYKDSYKIFEQDEQKSWVVKDRSVALFETQKNGNKKVFEYTFNQPHLSLVEQFENIVTIDSIGVFICLENGFGFLSNEDLDDIHKASTISDYKLILKGTYLNADDEKRTIVYCLDSARMLIPFRHKRLGFSVATMASPGNKINYTYSLKSNEGIDVMRTNKTDIIYERLSAGDYELTIFAKDQWGKNINPYTVFIEVQVPFIMRTEIKIFIGILLITALIIIYTRYSRRLKAYFEDETDNQNESKEDASENDGYKHIVEEKNSLVEEIKRQNQHIANSALNNIRNKEVLTSLKKELKDQKEKLGLRYPEKYYKKIVSIIDKNIDVEEDWHVFEKHFDEANGDFFNRLKEEYPQLTPRDLRMCAYLKMNMSSKEIAPLLNISERSVEVHRYRLRKKMDLQGDDNLSEFMIKY